MKRSEPARAVVQFAVTGTCALLLLGFLAVTLLRNTGKSEAIRDARQTTRLAGEGVVARLGVTDRTQAALWAREHGIE